MSQLNTPGADRIVRFRIGANTFGFRRPSRADTREIQRRFVLKLVGSLGLDVEADLLNRYDGRRLLAEARCEVGLRPVARADGSLVDLGETAPAHWLEDSGSGTQKRQIVSFANVSEEELDAVDAYLEENVFKKKAGATEDSGAFVVVPIND